MVTALFLCPLLSWIFGSFHPAVYIQRNPHILAEHLTNWAAGIDRKEGGGGIPISIQFPIPSKTPGGSKGTPIPSRPSP